MLQQWCGKAPVGTEHSQLASFQKVGGPRQAPGIVAARPACCRCLRGYALTLRLMHDALPKMHRHAALYFALFTSRARGIPSAGVGRRIRPLRMPALLSNSYSWGAKRIMEQQLLEHVLGRVLLTSCSALC